MCYVSVGMRQSRYNIWVREGDSEYVYNGMSGALLRTPRGTEDDVRRLDAGELPEHTSVDLLQRLTHGRMLVSDDVDELGLLRTRYELTRSDPSLLGLTLVSSAGCNFDCPYCFEDKRPSIMSAEVQAAILALVDEQLPRLSQVYVTWFGGEPLLGKEVIWSLGQALIDRCDAAGIGYASGIITNGWHLDEDTCRRLAELRVATAQVSLDGPAATHDLMRPRVGGKPSFDRIVENLHHAVEHLQVNIRINADKVTLPRAEELLARLAAEGLAGRLQVYAGQIVGGHENMTSPAVTFTSTCYTSAEFAEVELAFSTLAARYGFGRPGLPQPSGAPCTAVRKNELVVGAKGELYKCWESVGNPRDEIGTIFDHANPNTRLRKWLQYDPVSDPECSTCIALPGCMGGCAQHSMDLIQHDNRCGTFRHNYRDRITTFVDYVRQTGGGDEVVPAATLARAMSR